MRPLELTRSGIVATIAVFLVAAVCVRLGIWQLDRRSQRLERNATVAERLESAPVNFDSPPADTTGLTFRRARLQGLYDNGRSFVLGARSLGGSPGVHLFTPLRTGDGAVLVNRGWLPSSDAATVDLDSVRVDTAVTAEGILLPIPVTGTAPADGEFRARWFRLDADAVRAQYPYPVPPLYLQLVSDGDAAVRAAMDLSPSSPVPLPAPSLDGGPHLSYAFQWFGFAVIFVGGWAALVMGRGAGRAPGRGTTPQP